MNTTSIVTIVPEKQVAPDDSPQSGQSIILFAFLLIGLLAIMALAIDGGLAFTKRRITQNAADASVFAGVHYLAATDAPSEPGLRAKVNAIIESNAIPDTDGIPGNETNGNITIYYTDDNGNRLVGYSSCADGQAQLPCGSMPLPARGLEVLVSQSFPTFFAAVIGHDTASVAARAVAVIRGSNANSDLSDNVLVSLGACPYNKDSIPFDSSAHNVDFVGGLHSNTYFVNRGEDNHYHGQVTYVDGAINSQPAIYEPQEPVTATVASDPFAWLSVADFDCVTGSIGSALGSACYDLTKYDLSKYKGEITTRFLQNNSPPGSKATYLDKATNRLLPGLYYGGNIRFDFGVDRMTGNVTLVTSNTIKTTGNDIHLTAYMPEGSAIPGLLMYSSYAPPETEKCREFEKLDKAMVAINTTGNVGTVQPAVYHEDDGEEDCVLPQVDACYAIGSNSFYGLTYAPRGMVATSGHGSTYIGAILGYTIRINGYADRIEGEENEPDRVGALFVNNPGLFPVTEPRIYLEE